MRALVVRPGRRVDRRPRVLRRPCDAFHHVLVFPELNLMIPNNFALRMNVGLASETRNEWITFVSFVDMCHTRTV